MKWLINSEIMKTLLEKAKEAKPECGHCEREPGIPTMLRWRWNYCPKCGTKLNTDREKVKP